MLKQSQKIVVLPMNISAYFQRGLKLNENGLLEEDLPRLEAKSSDLILSEIDLLAWSVSSDGEQLLYDAVDVDIDFPFHLLLNGYVIRI